MQKIQPQFEEDDIPVLSAQEFAEKVVAVLVDQCLLPPTATIEVCKFGNYTGFWKAHSFEIELDQVLVCKSIKCRDYERQFDALPSKVVLRVGSEHHHKFSQSDDDVEVAIVRRECWSLVFKGVSSGARVRASGLAWSILQGIYTPAIRMVAIHRPMLVIDNDELQSS